MLKRFPVHHPNLINLEDVKVIHYVGDNPWDIHQKRAEFTQLERLWAEFLEAEDWRHEFWMNKTFISRRWAKLTSNVKKRPRIPVTTKLVQRVKSLRQVKRIKKWVHQLAPKGVRSERKSTRLNSSH